LTGDSSGDEGLFTLDNAGRFAALDLAGGRERWSDDPTYLASGYGSPAIARAGARNLVVAFARQTGIFPTIASTDLLILDGSTGALRLSAGGVDGLAGSPIAVDLNGDGFDEIILDGGAKTAEEDNAEEGSGNNSALEGSGVGPPTGSETAPGTRIVADIRSNVVYRLPRPGAGLSTASFFSIKQGALAELWCVSDGSSEPGAVLRKTTYPASVATTLSWPRYMGAGGAGRSE
jgi:hypothetical protein